MAKKSLKSLIKPLALVVWSLLIGVFFWHVARLGIPISKYPAVIAGHVQSYGIWAPIMYIALFAVRPLIFFPATLLSLSAGVLFGPYRAIGILIVAENLSSLVSFYMGSYFGKHLLQKLDTQSALAQKIDNYVSENGFISILTLRLVYAPFDLVGYMAGASKISYRSFASATFIGILPGLTTSAFLGGSIYNASNLAISGIFFILGIVISRIIKARYGTKKSRTKAS